MRHRTATTRYTVQTAVKIGIIAFALLVLFAGFEAAYQPAGSPEVVKAQLAVSRHLAQQAVEALGSKPNWTGISIEKSDLNDFALTIHYTALPDAPDAVATDTRTTVAAMLYQLTLAGHHPTDEQTTITAQAQYEQNGRPVVLGSAHYDFAKDKVVADPAPR